MSNALFTPVVLFENNELIVVNKPAGIPSIPERNEKDNDLLHLLSKHTGIRLYVVHRLDKGVTGAIIYAKTPDAHKFLNDQFSERRVKKTYMALVHGVVKGDRGIVNAPIRKFGSGRMGVDAVSGVEATTHWDVKEEFAQHTLLKVNPLTGRRHQIRVHLFSIGHPIVGDPLYGEKSLQKPYRTILLHAHEIEFEAAPGEKLTVTATMPPYFHEVRQSLPKPA